MSCTKYIQFKLSLRPPFSCQNKMRVVPFSSLHLWLSFPAPLKALWSFAKPLSVIKCWRVPPKQMSDFSRAIGRTGWCYRVRRGVESMENLERITFLFRKVSFRGKGAIQSDFSRTSFENDICRKGLRRIALSMFIVTYILKGKRTRIHCHSVQK